MSDATRKKESAKEHDDSPWRRRARRLALWIITIELIGFVVYIGALLLGESSRLTMIALYLPRQPFLVVAVLGAIVAPFTRWREGRSWLTGSRALAAVHVVLVFFVLFGVMGFCIGGSRESTNRIRLASYNIYFGKLNRPALLDELAAMDVDILVLQATYDSLGDLKQRFPDRATHRVDDFILVSRFAIKSVEEPAPLADGELPKFVCYVLETPAGPLRVYNVHPFSPRHALFDDDETKNNIAHREAQIEAAVWSARADGPPFVIVGDTNLPPWSAIARRHLGRFHEAFADVGFGFGYTFPAKRPWMRIDRAFAGDRVRFLDARVGARGASDHRPIFVDFELVK
jgi:endonuclease/exonuclease/phosphatase family metal-dependent hydrolase